MVEKKEEEVTDLTKIGEISGTMTRPSFIEEGDMAGTEDITREDVRLPRLAIAQGLSPQVTPGDAQFIDGLQLFDMFNDLSGEIYGKGPLTFIPVRRDVRRIEFIPRSEGGGIVDMDVPAGDPRLKWTVDNGVKRPPAATTFIEFVILLLRPNKAPEPIVLSIKGTNKHNRRASDQLTTFIKLRNLPIYAGLYRVDTLVPAKNDKGTFGVPRVKNAGNIPDNPVGRALYEFSKKFHDSLEGKTIVVQRETPAEEDFDPETLEHSDTKPGDATDM